MAHIPGEPIYVDQGDTPTLVFAISVDDGLPFDPSSAAGTVIASKSAASANPGPDIFFMKSTTDGSALFDTLNGQPVLKALLARTDTNDVSPGQYYYEAIILEAGGGVRSHVAKGPFYVLQTVGK